MVVYLNKNYCKISMYPLRPQQGPSNPLAARRQLLWNVSEPGDPYDIKKSMIAKIPGDKKIFMGDHLELVCLLQAAQIERLCEFLQDYKLKFREIERSALDRHSYEVQIKELTQKLQEETSKVESTKYVDFIKRQQAQIEQLQKNNRDNSGGLKQTYERSLQMANHLNNQNIELRRQKEELQLQLMNSVARYEALEKGKNKEIQDIKIYYSQSSRDQYESSVVSLKLQYQGEIRKYDLELKRIKDINEVKNSEINDLMAQREDLARRLTANEGKADLQRQLYEYQNKFVLFGQEIERLNIALRDYTNKLEQSDMRRRELERAAERSEYEKKELDGRLRSKEGQIAHLNEVLRRYELDSQKIGESKNYLIQYEQQISSLQRDLSDIGSKLKYESELSKKYKEEAEKLNFQLSKSRLLEKENNDLRSQTEEINTYRKNLAQAENRAAILKDEIERLKSMIAAKDSDLDKARLVFNENESLKVKARELESTIVSKYEYEISRVRTEYEQQMELITRNVGSQIQGKSQLYQNQLQKMKEALRVKTQEAERYKIRIYELETIINRNQLEVTAKIRTYESNITSLKRDNEDIYNKLRALGESDRKAYELEARLAQYERELDRVSQASKAKDEEILNLRNRLRETEGVGQKYQNDFGRKVTVYEQTITSIRTENDQIRKKLNDLITESNRKLQDASMQIERLGKNILKLKEQNTALRQTAQDFDIERQKNQKLLAENEQLRRRLVEAENKYNSIYNDSSSHLKNLEQVNDTLKRQLLESKSTITKYEVEMSRVSSSMETSLTNAGRQNENLRRKVSEYETKLSQISMEFERLNSILKNKNEEYSKLETRYNQISSDYESAIKQFKQYELMVKTKYEGEVSQSYSNYQKTIKTLKNDLEELRKKYNELQSNYRQLHQESSQEIQNLRRQLNQKDTSISSFEGEYKKKVSLYEANIMDLTRINEQLQKQLKELDKFAKQRTDECSRLEILIKNNNTELESTRRKLLQVGGDTSRRLSEYEIRYNQLGQERDNLIKRVESYESSISTYESEVKRRFQQYEQKTNILTKENEGLRRKLQQSGDVNRRNAEYESKLALMASQIQRLHINLNSLSQQNETLKKQLSEKTSSVNQYQMEVSRKLSILQQDLDVIQKENIDLKKRLKEYEQRLLNMSQQLQRVNSALKNKNEDSVRFEQTIKVTYEQSLVQIKREKEDLSRMYNEVENRYILSSQEIERLTQNLKAKQDDLIKLDQQNRSQANDLETWKRKYADLEADYSHTYEVEVTKKYALYEQNMADLKKQNEDYRVKITGTMQEIERLNNILRLKVDESVQLNTKINSLSSDIEDYRRKLRETENVSTQNFTTLKNQRDELTRKLQEWDAKVRQTDQNNERKIAEYENKIRVMSQEIDRLNEVLRTKNIELEQSRRQFKEYQDSVTMEVKGNYSQYETTVSNLNKEIEDLKRKLNENSIKTKEYQSKLVMTSHEIDRLDNMINIKTQQLVVSRRDFEELRRKWQESNEVTRKIPEYEQKLSLLMRQNQKQMTALRQKTDELNILGNKMRQVQLDLDSSRKQINQYEIELNRKVSSSEQTIVQFRRENEDLIRRKGEYESKIALMGQQLERVNSMLKSKNEQFLRVTQQYQTFKRTKESQYQDGYKTLNQNYSIVINEYEVAKKHLIEYEESIKKLYAEFERLQNILNQLKKERDNLIDKNKILSEEINRLNGENKDLEEQTRDIRLRLTDQTALQKRISEHLGLMVILFAEIETLRNRVREKEKEVVEVRKSSLAPHMV